LFPKGYYTTIKKGSIPDGRSFPRWLESYLLSFGHSIDVCDRMDFQISIFYFIYKSINPAEKHSN